MPDPTDCPYCDGTCISVDDRDGSCYVKNCVAVGLECQTKVANEIVRLRALAFWPGDRKKPKAYYHA